MSTETKGWDKDNYKKFQELFKKYRLPKNYNENPYGGIAMYELKELGFEDTLEYIKVYCDMEFSSSEEISKRVNLKPNIEDTRKTCRDRVKSMLKYRPKSEHDEILKFTNSILANKSFKVDIFSNPIFSNSIFFHGIIVSIILISTYLGASYSGTWDGVGTAFTILSFSTFSWGILTILFWYKLRNKSDLKKTEIYTLIYTSTILVALVMTVFIVSPYEPESDITCYKVNGKTECFSERQFDRMLDKYRD